MKTEFWVNLGERQLPEHAIKGNEHYSTYEEIVSREWTQAKSFLKVTVEEVPYESYQDYHDRTAKE